MTSSDIEFLHLVSCLPPPIQYHPLKAAQSLTGVALISVSKLVQSSFFLNVRMTRMRDWGSSDSSRCIFHSVPLYRTWPDKTWLSTWAMLWALSFVVSQRTTDPDLKTTTKQRAVKMPLKLYFWRREQSHSFCPWCKGWCYNVYLLIKATYMYILLGKKWEHTTPVYVNQIKSYVQGIHLVYKWFGQS